MRKLQVTSYGVVLPSATDVVALASYVASILSFAIGMISLAHPNLFGASADVAIQATVPLISITIAGAIQIANIWRNTSAKKAAINAAQGVAVMSRNEYLYNHGDQQIRAKAALKLGYPE